MAREAKGLLLTAGHSNRPIEELLQILAAHGVQTLVDVRTIPRSRRNPQFDGEALARALRAAGFEYLHVKALGGLRKTRADSPNMAWRNESFRGYADYMLSPEFARALDDLLSLAGRTRVLILCAEAVPWRCHRSLIADAATVRGWEVRHIMSVTAARLHELNPAARVGVDGKLTYPAEPLLVPRGPADGGTPVAAPGRARRWSMPRGASAKREREYEKLKGRFKKEGRYKGRETEVASRIVNKQRSQYGETKRARQQERRGESPDSGLPIKGYRHLTVAQIKKHLEKLSPAQLRKVRAYEVSHKNRKTLLQAMDRLR